MYWEEEPGQVSQWKVSSAPCRIVLVGRDLGNGGFYPASRAPVPPRHGCGTLAHARGCDKLRWVRDGFCLRKDLQGLRDRKNCSRLSSECSNAAFSLVVGKNPPWVSSPTEFESCEKGLQKRKSQLLLGWQPGRGDTGHGINYGGGLPKPPYSLCRRPASGCTHCATA